MPITARAEGDVRRLNREAVPVLQLAPGLGQPVHRDREVLPVELPGHLRVAEENQAEQREHLLKGGDELTVQAIHRLEALHHQALHHQALH
jgi:hypothetical protein